jgi:hypothetical protein
MSFWVSALAPMPCCSIVAWLQARFVLSGLGERNVICVLDPWPHLPFRPQKR